MNTDSSSRLNTALNHVQYRNEMASLDPNDPELARKIAFINRKYGYGGSQKRRQHNGQHQHVYHLKNRNETSHKYQESASDNETHSQNETPVRQSKPYVRRSFSSDYLNNLFKPYLGNFNEHMNNVNNLLSRFQHHFEESTGPLNVDSASDFNPSDAYNTLVNGQGTQNGYTKYVSSFTSFDSSGQKRGATVSGVEKTVNGQRTVSKKIRRFENGVETVEQVFPDGRRVTTTRNLTTRNLKQSALPTVPETLPESHEDTTVTETA